ncbi:hypothetical protein BOTCAL_1467g00020 [Botryotinia calthae]|uniref:DDE-1 domain-containing protein n=1 Tax=Botryotinia calthae TaxID=38488 RepID=A0A4Y8CEG8_9HELO|nr:hypothetical protein BOTCAL_1467g00020 [Botryotinia calthae]
MLQDPIVLTENVYNMDETGVMLSMLGSIKVLVSKHDTRDYRGARVKRTIVTAIECISGDGRYLNPMIIWPASTHRSMPAFPAEPAMSRADEMKDAYTLNKTSKQNLAKHLQKYIKAF